LTGWVGDIQDATVANQTFRTVLYTGTTMQLTVMRLRAGEEIGWERHDHIDQFLRVEQGSGEVQLGSARGEVEEKRHLEDDWAVVVPAGTWHNVVNAGDGDLRLYSLYAPPEHPDGAVHPTKADADAAEAEHHAT
jgi:mannose-6-phosphate isomerase-like protein (cupin superfamily)